LPPIYYVDVAAGGCTTAGSQKCGDKVRVRVLLLCVFIHYEITCLALIY